MDNYQDDKFKEGYRTGEYERIALATKNSDLRSDLLRMQQNYTELLHLVDELATLLNHNVFAHDEILWCEKKNTALQKYKFFKENK